jgi:hypothetical protein
MPITEICSQYQPSDNMNNEVGSPYPNYDLAPIPGFVGYFGSSDGHIVDNRTGTTLTEWDDRGRRRVRIGKATEMVHNLIIRAFTGRPPCKGYFVRWRNGDKSDNSRENLIWAGKPRS